MMHVKMYAAAAAVVGGLGLASASAAPLAPAGADTITGPSAVSTVAFGCGPGWAPGPYGRCRPIYRRPRFYGPRCFFRPTPFGPRRVCRY
ncbi:GCG_CRPN prefix-to-repeats domain-containing protein [Methylobacterium sp. P5_C11]